MPRFAIVLALLIPASLHAQSFPEPADSETLSGSPMPAEAAAAAFAVPEGFEVTVFATEPQVRNPVACSWDSRGRFWIAENFTYERRDTHLDTRYRDRVIILDDPDGNGKAEQHVVFHDQLSNLTSIEWSPDGLWLMCPPKLLFIADKDRDDQPDGPATVVLDGFTVPHANHHNFANGLRWGPDGWLYGRCGASAPGEVGRPGTSAAGRIPVRGGIWRYHPQHHTFESLNSGCTNPWGHDWDKHGELFFVNTVNGHFFHSITGAHFNRGVSIDENPHAYELLRTHADHFHYDTKGSWTKSRDGAANEFGGGHCHIGMMIYEGTNWPAEYRGRVFTLNQHGRRANQEHLERRGSGYVAKHLPDLLIAKDKFFRAIDITTGPDGGVYVIDWSDIGECHESSGVHRSSGRVFRVTHRDGPLQPRRELSKCPPEELAGLQVSDHSWEARMARLELHASPLAPASISILRDWLQRSDEPIHRLRAMWALHQGGALDHRDLRTLLKDKNEHVRVWAIRLLTDRFPLDTVFSKRPARPEPTKTAIDLLPALIELATHDPSPLVRLALASTLQRLPVRLRSRLALPLVRHPGDAADHNLPLMIWYGLIPVADHDPTALAQVAAESKIPKVRRFITRRLAGAKAQAALGELLAATVEADETAKSGILSGLDEAYAGWQSAPVPPAWKSFTASLRGTADPALRDRVRGLDVLFGDGRALDEVKRLALDPKVPLETRKSALRTLINQGPEELKITCLKLLNTRFLNTVAVEGLARFDDPKVAELIVLKYNNFHPGERPRVLEVLVTRPVFAHALLERVAIGKIPRRDLTALHARQIQSLDDPELTAKLTETWGRISGTAAEQDALLAKFRKELTPATLAQADKSRGRVLHEALCAGCHKLYGHGAAIGPDLTGGGRDNLDYLLENIVTPSAVVTADYQFSLIRLKDGRVLSGMIRGQNDTTLTLQSIVDPETIALEQINSIEKLPVSLMPPGLLEALTAEQRRNLIGYLMHPNQVARPGE